jgi:hypothetical protein
MIRIKAIRTNPLQFSEDQNKTNNFYAQRFRNQIIFKRVNKTSVREIL